MKIYIPSRGRASQLMTNRWIKCATCVVPVDEVDRYKRALSRIDGDYEIVGCPEDGIAKTRHWIGGLASSRGQDKFLMMDDDLMFCTRISNTDYKLRPSKPEDIPMMLKWTDNALNSAAHASVSIRGDNGLTSSRIVGPWQTAVKRNKRTLRYLAYCTEPFLKMKHGRVPVMEDFDVNLQLLRAGYENIVSFFWAQDQRATGMPGGCSTYRSLQVHNASALRLLELHPEFVKLRDKENKAKGIPEELRKRKEVTIQWEKAYKSSER